MTITAEVESWPEHVVFNNVSWELYERLLRETREQNLRFTYDDGVLEIMSPLAEHEKYKGLIKRMIDAISEELSIPISSYGSTTFKRKSLKKGFEPDECFYIQHEHEMRWRRRIDIRRDPPPDLVVEVDVSYRTIDKHVIYAAMRVPEIWSCDDGKLECLHLRAGKYQRRQNSLAFPFLQPADLEKYLEMLGEADESTIVRAWRDRLRRLRK